MKTYLIIGGSSGISQAIAKRLSNAGETVLTASRSGSGPNHQHFDATQPGTLDLPDQLNALVYAPGSITLKPFHRLTAEEMLQEFQLNALAAAQVIQQALPALKRSSQASILLFSTVAVQTGMPFHASIAMAKGAIEGLTRSLAAELAPKIRVNAIAPSLTQTPLADPLLNSDSKREAAAQRHPLKSIGQADDLAELATFLLSENAKFITGQIIQADGGIGSLRTF
ncbi:SDR family NAD(P)-dependent oxidoreductase [Rubritalea marina]|uniref:SDR family NAD(P)-dependent oxidoreductase n=1 Tax=Rubritalea marina TaxID=361055 RepID=UPI00036317B4|nr:SDR family oxidoreductase [Rubritalea marina]